MSVALYKHTIRLAVPAIVENLFKSAIFLVDALMVATLGPAPLAAAGLAGVVLWRLSCTFGCLEAGVGATVARRWGEGNTERAGVVYTHGAILGFLSGLILLSVLPAAPLLFRAMNADGEVLELSILYFQTLGLVFPFAIARLSLAASLRASGNMRASMNVTIIGNLFNVAANYVLIFGKFGFPAMGLKGAAIASALAILLEFILLLMMGIRGVRSRVLFPGAHQSPKSSNQPVQFADFHFRREGITLRLPIATRSILRIAHPVFWEEITVSSGFLVFFAMIAHFGEVPLAAHTAIIRIESFSFMAGFGLSMAAAALVGQALGARNPAQARRIFSITLTLGAAVMGILGILFALLPDWFLGWFMTSSEPAFMDIGRTLFLIAALEQPFIATGMVLAAGLRGAGMTKAPFLSQLLGVIGIRVTVGYFLAFELGMGMEGIYWATLVDWMSRTVVLGIIVWRGRWEKVIV